MSWAPYDTISKWDIFNIPTTLSSSGQTRHISQYQTLAYSIQDFGAESSQSQLICDNLQLSNREKEEIRQLVQGVTAFALWHPVWYWKWIYGFNIWLKVLSKQHWPYTDADPNVYTFNSNQTEQKCQPILTSVIGKQIKLWSGSKQANSKLIH